MLHSKGTVGGTLTSPSLKPPCLLHTSQNQPRRRRRRNPRVQIRILSLWILSNPRICACAYGSCHNSHPAATAGTLAGANTLGGARSSSSPCVSSHTPTTGQDLTSQSSSCRSNASCFAARQSVCVDAF